MRLPLKQRLFVIHYLGKAQGNATLAARLAGFKSPRELGHRLLKKVAIREAIDEKVSEAAMSAEEVLARLSDLASTTADDFLAFDADRSPDRLPRLDLRKAKRRGMLASVKKIKSRQETPDSPSLVNEVELHDAHKSLAQLAKYHGLVDGKGNAKSAEEVRKRIIIPGADARPTADPG